MPQIRLNYLKKILIIFLRQEKETHLHGGLDEGRVADHLWLGGNPYGCGGNPYGWGVMILMVGG